MGLTIGLSTVLLGDCLAKLEEVESESVNCCITSPPYYKQRDYEVEGQIGQEESPESYVEKIVAVMRQVKRVLRNDGTLWLNLGDSYENKQLLGIPWRVALALQADGWYLRSDVIWHKLNVMPEPATDRPVKTHEYFFMLSKSPTYYYDWKAIREPVKQSSLDRATYGFNSDRASTKNGAIHVEKMGTRFVDPDGRRKRTVWTVATESVVDSHDATFPPKLIEPCILASAPPPEDWFSTPLLEAARRCLSRIVTAVAAWASNSTKRTSTSFGEESKRTDTR